MQLEKMETDFTKFSITDFLKEYPQPQKYFTTHSIGKTYIYHSTYYLKKRFCFVSAKIIANILVQNNYNLVLTAKALAKLQKSRVTIRKKAELKKPEEKIKHFLDEVMFLEHEREIMDFIKVKKQEAQEKIYKAKLAGELFECPCCCNEEIMFDELIGCSKGHLFCNTCVKRNAEILIGEGRYEFPCLSSCGAVFECTSLKDLLHIAVYEKLLKRKQEMEVKAANIPGIEFCRYCEYAEIPPEGDNIFKCKNCNKESCRLCNRDAHNHLTCKEALEKCQITGRKFIEDTMTQALIRTCYRCKRNFIKQDGCNKMVCTCGAKMCYICRKPVYNYFHFAKRKEPNKCPLYSNNNDLHIEAVRKAGEEAKLKVKDEISSDYDPFKGLTPEILNRVDIIAQHPQQHNQGNN